MKFLFSRSGPSRQAGAVTAVQPSVRMALAMSFLVLGLAGAYFGVVYLIAR
jgi:hypothetical protein